MYWMSRDQRSRNNKALLFAQHLAIEHQQPLLVVFVKTPVRNAQSNHYNFLVQGLVHVQKDLDEKDIPFFFLEGELVAQLEKFVADKKVGAVITDFTPLRGGRKWRDELAKSLPIPLIEVDAHNVVPAWVASPKQEYAARTFRPKMERILPEWLRPLPELQAHPFPWKGTPPNIISFSGKIPSSGERAAQATLSMFLKHGLQFYHEMRNNPSLDVQSHLSPYLHFGQIAPLEVALAVKSAAAPSDAKQDFLEELIIRRELADNYCLYNRHYDSFQGFPDWAQQTLIKHAADPRANVYSYEQLESGKTHDKLWNAAQEEMVKSGHMHGYLRMYWAKKILEWTANVAQAQEYAILLNDTYSLDGRDPNGYTGIAWSIGGVHDRPWYEREIFGTVRYMALSGMKKKFDIASYIQEVSEL